jgi:hypothetical protein
MFRSCARAQYEEFFHLYSIRLPAYRRNDSVQLQFGCQHDTYCWQPNWGRPGFDVGREAAQGMPRSSYLVKPLETINANDERFALAA